MNLYFFIGVICTVVAFVAYAMEQSAAKGHTTWFGFSDNQFWYGCLAVLVVLALLKLFVK